MDTPHQVYLVFGLDVSSYLYGYQFNQESKSINAIYTTWKTKTSKTMKYPDKAQFLVLRSDKFLGDEDIIFAD